MIEQRRCLVPQLICPMMRPQRMPERDPIVEAIEAALCDAHPLSPPSFKNRRSQAFSSPASGGGSATTSLMHRWVAAREVPPDNRLAYPYSDDKKKNVYRRHTRWGAPSMSQLVKDSKLLSLVLRHEPEKIGIALDAAGWVAVADLIAGLKRRDPHWTVERLRDAVTSGEKQRFAFDESATKIRALQGHSVKVELGYERREPPAQLYHGTVARFLPSIRKEGLVAGQRHHVHLSIDETTAKRVGARRGIPVVLVVAARRMAESGAAFFEADNGVWLTLRVPPEFIAFPT
jgi:putative RNA 2'-phosphotransferase